MKPLGTFALIAVFLFPLQLLSQTRVNIPSDNKKLSKDGFYSVTEQDEQIQYRLKLSGTGSLITDSIQQYWTGVEWVNSWRHSFNYDLNNNRIEDLYSNWSSSGWSVSSMLTYGYDGNNNIIERLYQTRDGSGWLDIFKNFYTYISNYLLENLWKNWDGSGWVTTGRLTYDYDIVSNLTEMLNQGWNGSEWENLKIYSYGYDLDNNKISFLLSNWDGSGWVNWTQTLYTYDANNNLTEAVHQDWKSSEWVNNSRYTYTYDAENKLIESVISVWYDSNWVSGTKYIYTYDGNNITEELRLQGDGPGWRNYWRTAFTYDSENNLVEKLRQEWELFGGRWVNDWKEIYEYAPTGIEQLTDGIESYSLSDNYPNPFNPGTKIKYSIPHLSQVQITVYNILGDEMGTIINEEKPAGTYELTWNAANLPSGVYFYQLRATPGGEQAVDPSISSGQVFVQTKKMILLK